MVKVKVEGKEYNYKPSVSAMYKYKMMLRINSNTSFRNCFKFNITKPFFKDVSEVANSQEKAGGWIQNLILQVYGETGSSKSMSALSIGIKYFKNFSENNVKFFDQQILDSSHKYPPNSFIIRDENSAKGVFGIGSTRTVSQTQMMAETCRKFGLSLCLIEPSFVINPIAKYYLSTIDVDIKNRITRLGVQDPVTLKFIGAVYLKVVDDENPVWIKYNKQKDEFINSVMSGNLQGAKLDYETMIDKIMCDADLQHCSNKKERKSLLHLKFPTYAVSEINVMSDLLEMELRK